jgi:integrase/recombinase XerC
MKNRGIAAFIDHQKAAQKSASTLKSYQCDLTVFARWFQSTNQETLALTKITPTDARQFKRYLINSKFKPSTINRKLLTLKYFLEWGWDTKKIKCRFPLPKLVKQVATAPKWLTRIEQNALLRHIEQSASVRDITIIKILMNTGLRVQELCDLSWSDITIAERKGNLAVRNSKGEKYREIPLNKESRNAFNAIDYKQHAGTDTLIFLGQRGNLTPRGVQLIFKRLISNSKLDTISPHQLRHTFCKNLVDAGVTLEKVAALAGHERLDTTKMYCKPSLADLSDAVELIGEEE